MRITTFLFLLTTTIVFANDKKKTTSTIERVTVFLEGAQIKRSASTNLSPGLNEIIIHNLSPNVDESSIQISGLKNTSIRSMNFNLDYLEKKKDSEELKLLENQLDALLLKKNRLENVLSGLNQEKKVLENNQRIGGNNTSLSLEKVKLISIYYRERAIEIQNEAYTISKKINELNKNIQDLHSEINKLSDQTEEARGEIIIKIDSPTATNLILEIRYNVTNAGWFPLYDIKSKNTNTPLNIAYKANVYQQTGTDWENAKVILSTGDPNTNNIKPDLGTKYLNFTYNNYRRSYKSRSTSYKYNPTIRRVSGIVKDQNGLPIPYANILEKGTTNGTTTDFNGKYNLNIQGGRELQFSFVGFVSQTIPIYSSTINLKLEADASGLEEVVIAAKKESIRRMAASAEAVAQLAEEAANRSIASKEEGITNTRFIIKKKYTIKSNADITSIEIDNFDMDAEYSYYVAPELNENVFLTAKLGNWEQFNLLAGEANIYFEGSYAGKTNIDPQATTDSLTISLGMDPNIVVKREPLKNFKSKSFYGSNRIVDLGYKIELKNNKQNPIQLILEDRIPVSQNKEIKVDNIQTNDAYYDPKTGIMKWKLQVKSKAQLEKQFSYQLKYPKNKRVNL